MNRFLVTLITVSTFALSLSACMQEQPRASQRAPGTYENTKSATDADGTDTQEQSTTEISVDDNGHRKTVVKSKKTRDPKGLLNKTTTKKTTSAIEK